MSLSPYLRCIFYLMSHLTTTSLTALAPLAGYTIPSSVLKNTMLKYVTVSTPLLYLILHIFACCITSIPYPSVAGYMLLGNLQGALGYVQVLHKRHPSVDNTSD